MLGIIYLILAGILGYKASKILIEEGTKFSFINRIWLTLPASFGVGTLLLTWVVYIISWFFSVIGKVKNPLLYGNAIGMAGVLIFIILIEVQKYRSHSSLVRSNMEIGLTEQIDQDRKLKKKSRKFSMDNLITDKSRFKKELILFGLLAAFITYMMFYVFYMKEGILYSGLTVYGDYAPHTAMIRSFSMGNNFPTQYPHYGGADVNTILCFSFWQEIWNIWECAWMLLIIS